MILPLRFQQALEGPTALSHTAEIIQKGGVKFALDIGCGSYSHLSVFRPQLTTVGIDSYRESIEKAKLGNVHDFYIVADILKDSLDSILSDSGGRRLFDLVTLYGVIEHLRKKNGYDLLERCEQLTSKYVLLQTPNGFVEQGPEFGNEHQRHLSGWFPHDFEGLGYKVYGTSGTKYLRGIRIGS